MYRKHTLPRFLMFVASLIFFHSSNAEVMCFKNETHRYEVEYFLKLSLFENGKTGFVKYRGHRDGLQIRFKGERSLSKKNARPPVTVERTWTEFYAGRDTGEYRLITNGANVGELTYKRKKDGRLFRFSEDQEAYIPENCAWDN